MKNKVLFLTGMRGYAALAVFMVHSTMGFNFEHLPVVRNLLNFGKFGVVVFFVLSAYTIYFTLQQKSQFQLIPYVIKRVARIVPLFFAVLAVAFVFNLGEGEYYRDFFGIAYSWKILLADFSLISLVDLRYRNALIGVEWTLFVEIFYYAVIPLLIVVLRKSPQRIMPLLLISFIVSYFSINYIGLLYPSSWRDLADQFSYPRYFFSYVVGISLYYVIPKFAGYRWRVRDAVLLLLMLVLFAALVADSINTIIFVTMWTAVLIMQASQGMWKSVLENKVAVYLGEISYSFYLLHILILPLLPRTWGYFGVVGVGLAATIFFSSITYFAIELPFQSLGRKIARRFDRASLNLA